MKATTPRVVFMVLVTAACGGTSAVTSDGGLSDGGTLDGSAATDSGTTEACATTVTGDVPELYKRFFQCVDLSATATDVVIHSRGLPPYKTYYYGSASPNFAPFDTSRGAEYKGNPNTLKEQNVTLRIPKAPVERGVTITAALIDGIAGGQNSTYDYKMGTAGVAINSVLMYNPLAAPGDDIEKEKYTFDDYNAHPDPGGNYHYHTTSKGPLELLVKLGLATKSEPGKAELEVYGVMCDGTVVLGCTEMNGDAASSTALDAQNGHVHDLIAKDGTSLAAGRYHIHMCPTGFPAANSRKFTPEVRYYSTCVVE